MTADDAVELAGEICDLIDGIDGDTKARAAECGFDLEDIRERVVDVEATITESGRCSDKQARALENWKRGVSGWAS